MLNPGTKLGPYEILAPLGAGGMGEVYRARDTKLDRDVAIKVLPDSFASDADRVARFQREAKTLAALNHPNIGGIYGLEEGQGVTALVLELVEGQTLAERIEGQRAKGSGLAIDEALPIARQIAAALEAAHGQGIVHRDLKPANVKVRPDGTVKVLDFGLAKGLGTGVGPASTPTPVPSMSPTLTTPMMTGMGVVMGTAAYMAPEQAKGKPVDKRADIWAFGCVLYEMLTGRRPFDGDDVSDVMATVLKSDPDWTAIPSDVPPHIKVLIQRCLEKDARKRVADISVALFLMTEPFAAPAAAVDPARASRTRPWVPLVAGTAAVVVSAIAAVWITIVVTGRVPQPMRFAIVPSAAEPFAPQGTDRDIAVSPDGRRIVYRATVGGATKLVVRDVNQLDGKVLDGTDLARSPFVSPDGQWVAFQSGGVMKKVAITGGPPVTLCSLSGTLRGGSWQGDTIVFATGDQTTGLLSVPAAGGEPTILTKPDPGEGDHLFPFVLPDGRHVLFTIGNANLAAGGWQIAVLDLKTKARKVLVRGGSQAQYVTSGALVFAIAGTLRAARFDASSAEVTSEPVPVLEQVSNSVSGAANYAVSRDGLLVYVPGSSAGAEAKRTLVWVGRDGREEPVHTDARAFNDPRLSPDEQRALVEITDEADDIWMVDLSRGALTRQTFDAGEDESAVWMPDGKTIVYASTRAGTPLAVNRRRADGAGGEEPLWTGSAHVHVETSTPDGRALILSSAAVGGGQFDLMLLPLEGDRKLKPLVQTRFDDARARVSPDGRWIAYSSDETGRGEVYVRAFPSLEGKTQVSTGGGAQPVWAKRGDELFFRTPGAMMAVRIQPGASFSVGQPRKLFDGRFYSKNAGTGGYDVSRDGRFLMVKDASAAQSATGTPASLIVVLNWFEDLKARIK